jgi:hypothetical protein
MISRRTIAAGIVLTGALLTAGCTNTKVGPPTTITIDRTVTPTPSGPAPEPSGSTAPAHPVSTAAMHKLPGRCGNLLAAGRIDATLHSRVSGRTVFVVGLPDASIGRVGYINCQYGVPRGSAGIAKIEIQVSLYRTASKAAARIRPTVDDYTAHGAHARKIQVEGLPALLLTGGSGASYGPTGVMAVGQRTVVVTLRPGAVAANKISGDLTALLALAARRTSAH